jgi:hypothetical protein
MGSPILEKSLGASQMHQTILLAYMHACFLFFFKNIWIFPGVDCGKSKNKYNPEQQVVHVCQRLLLKYLGLCYWKTSCFRVRSASYE